MPIMFGISDRGLGRYERRVREADMRNVEWHLDSETNAVFHAVIGHSEGRQPSLCGVYCLGVGPTEKPDEQYFREYAASVEEYEDLHCPHRSKARSYSTCENCARLIMEAQ